MVGINGPWWVELILLVLAIMYLSSKSLASQGLAAGITAIPLAAFLVGMLVGDIYVFVFYEELRWAWPFGNPFVPPGAKHIVPTAIPSPVLR